MKTLTIFLLFLWSCTAEPTTTDVQVSLLEMKLALLTQKTETEAMMAKMLTRLNDAEMKIKELSNAKLDQENKMKALSSEKTQKEVAFTAALQPSSPAHSSGFGRIGPYSEEITLVHQKVLTNVGGAYDSLSGVFTAPVAGVYFFTFTTYSWVSEKDIGVRLMKNDEEVLLVWETQDKGDNEDYASNSVLLELVAGDRVFMRLKNGYQVAGSIYSNIHTFSGFLLYPKAK
ncbi:complement C1q-like protein 4 [Engraulis encrasicolus]|uniref:complement C1q-like protein 4 n=1 Tax=Engraulis encrasicolus TaxID=184585 RepID=UPI002FD20138